MTDVPRQYEPQLLPPRSDRFVVHSFDVIDSTNRYLLEEAAGGAADGLVAVADHQSQGRGRRGRVWDSKPGSSLLFSVLFRPPADAVLNRYAQAVGLAVTDAAAVLGGFDAQLKWPNDVLVGQRKLSGVLAEATTQGEKTVLVVGCGTNLNWKGEMPEGLANAVSADEAAGHTMDRDEMLDAVLTALTTRLSHSAWILDAYKTRCSTLGQRVRIERAESDLEGTAVDITDTGALVLDADGVRHEVSVGEAIHLRPV